MSKAAAAKKVVLGASRVTRGVLTATGHGVAGTFLKNHGLIVQANMLGREGFKRGMEQLREGIEEWKRS